MGGRGGLSWLTHAISPRRVAAAASAWICAGVPPAAFIPSDAARALNTAATACPSASPAAISLADAFPDSSAAVRCSPAFSVISATDVGNNSFRISAETPDSTASSDG